MSQAPPMMNPAQMTAVQHLDSPCLVLAGAGSGKTRVITHKIARLLQPGPGADLAPSQIGAITFTNKAAAEMRERVKALIGPKAASKLLVCTFHSLGVRLLREDGEVLGLKPKFSILDSDDVTSILRDAGSTTDAKLARSWQWQISLWKNMGLDSAAAISQAASDDEALTARIMKLYEERLLAYQAVDFDDLIGLPLKLLSEHEHVAHKWQRQLKHVLVDEYQDTNATQYELLKLLVGPQGIFTAVGDDDQSIYGWRGATLDNLKRLPQDFPNLKVIPLEQNYRSTSAILRAANNVIQLNPKLFQKTLWSDLGEGEPVKVAECDNEEHEAERAVARIQAIRGGMLSNAQPGDWHNFAILYRANHQARPFEQALRRANIPYKVSGGQSFFDRAEIKDLCAWLRLLLNNDDDPAFLRAVTTPKRLTTPVLAKVAGSGAYADLTGAPQLANVATTFAGKTAVNLNFTAGADAMAHAVERCGIRTILTSRVFLAKASIDEMPGMVFLEDLMGQISAAAKLRTLVLGFLMPAPLISRLYLAPASASQHAAVIFSSGSTGTPTALRACLPASPNNCRTASTRLVPPPARQPWLVPHLYQFDTRSAVFLPAPCRHCLG